MEHPPLILRANWVLPISSEPLPNGEVVVENGQIVEVRPQPGSRKANDTIDFGDAILMPGLVNTHCHLEYTALRGLNDRTPFFAWIRALVELKAQLPADLWLPSAMLGAAECLASGITFVADNSDSGVSAEALARSGLRGRVYQELFGIGKEPDDETLLKQLSERMDTLRKTIEKREATERISLGIAPHAVYTVRDSLLRAAVRYAQQQNLPLSIHASESSEEVALTRSGSGPFAEMFTQRGIAYLHPRVPPVEYLHRAGALTPVTQLVHCVRVESYEVRLIAESNASVAHCPRSNARLLTGVAPVYELRRRGVRIGLGTDSAVSSGSLDLLEEMRFGALMQRAHAYTAQPSWRDWVAIATLEGARSLGVDNQIGSLEPGKRADFVAIRTRRLAFSQMPDPHAALVLIARGEDVAMTMVDGTILYQDGSWRTLEPDKIRAKLAEMIMGG
ncbi:MAG: amidohydrolase family protein [Fimbriimonadales bacterium]|nr:amidohydrolase family protein [Fimbriimonadales bacterium]